MAKQTGILKLSLDKLKMFVEDRDQNLRYLGLLGLHHVMMHNSKLVADMRETVVECLNGEDITIRYRALELIVGMVNKKNIQVCRAPWAKRGTWECACGTCQPPPPPGYVHQYKSVQHLY